jgi:hypothetical protein
MKITERNLRLLDKTAAEQLDAATARPAPPSP